MWITKYRYQVLTKEIGLRFRELIQRICTEEHAEILSGVVSIDHVHLLVSIDPSISVSKLVQYLKGKRSRKLQQAFPELWKRYLGSAPMGEGIFCG
ncbi:MAG: putative transposase [Saprospiraceae bacterium]|jgi:putative transposase